MAYIELNEKSLEKNFFFLKNIFDKHQKYWGVVVKLLCGNQTYLEAVARLGPDEIHDSRMSNLEAIKKIAPDIQRVYIKPPPIKSIPRLVRCADVSFNTHIRTIRKINEEAGKIGVVHKILIMVELGDLREGVMGDNLLSFYKEVFELPNIEVIGIGANLNCLNGIMPSYDKLVQLSLYRELLNARFGSNIRWVSSGSSVTYPLISKRQVPKGCNHFRIGETLFFGNDIYENKPIKQMKQDVFTLKAEIIEVRHKPMAATGEQGSNLLGETPEIDPKLVGEEGLRVILDIGVLDVSPGDLEPLDPDVEVLGSSSDMMVVHIKKERQIRLGDMLRFRPNYTGVLSLMNSEYIEKRIA
jgi:predicted amino acid racemase